MQYEGLFEVLEHISLVAYKIRLPSSYQIHPLINMAHLETYKASPLEFGERPTKHIPQKDFGEMPEYKVEKIAEERMVKQGNRQIQQYKIQWLVYRPEEDWWKSKREL
jgi:hypothetical protein